jgi:hypothetical protein
LSPASFADSKPRLRRLVRSAQPATRSGARPWSRGSCGPQPHTDGGNHNQRNSRPSNAPELRHPSR